jgi:hypothetical protein
MTKLLERWAHVAWESLTITCFRQKSAGHEHAKCARRRGESAVWKIEILKSEQAKKPMKSTFHVYDDQQKIKHEIKKM